MSAYCLTRDRAAKGITLAPDAVVCPVCGEAFNCITAGHFRKHGYQTAQDFKHAFTLGTLKAPSIAAAHSVEMTVRNPMKGKLWSTAARAKMGEARRGKGIGVTGKYERTPEIRAAISRGVVSFQLENPHHLVKHFKGQWLELDVCAPRVWVRSSWEARVLRVLDCCADIEHVHVEPFAIPYIFGGVCRNYIPDFLIRLTCGIEEIWEVKPAELLHTHIVRAKVQALNDFVTQHGMNARIVTLRDIEGLEMSVFGEVR